MDKKTTSKAGIAKKLLKKFWASSGTGDKETILTKPFIKERKTFDQKEGCSIERGCHNDF